MERKITTWTKEWQDLEIYKIRGWNVGKVVLDKRDKTHICVYVQELRDVPSQHAYGLSDNKVLIYADTPKDYDGTEEDLKKKIDDAVREAEEIYNSIDMGMVCELQAAFDKYRIVQEKIYCIKSEMRGR